MLTKPNWLPYQLLLIVMLESCALQKPEVQPVAVPCRKPSVDPELLQPPRQAAKARLNSLLEPGLPSATPTNPSSAP